MNYYVNKSIAPSLRASAQTLVHALGLGVPRMLSRLIGGVMTEAWGTNVSLAVCTAVAGSGFLIYFLCFVRAKNSLPYHTAQKNEMQDLFVIAKESVCILIQTLCE